uniref:Protein RFT1 homolog n=1 Tax=Aegilops tauschii TaxID=37682 RepID=R7WCC5_AEGTA
MAMALLASAAGTAGAVASPQPDSDAGAVMAVFKYNFAAQFLSRIIPFLYNGWFVRQLSADDCAAYALQLPLFINCVLFLSREGFRRACLRNNSGSGDVLSDEEILKVAWMIIPFGLFVTFIGSLFVFRIKKLKLSDPYAKATLIIGFLLGMFVCYNGSDMLDTCIINLNGASFIIAFHAVMQLNGASCRIECTNQFSQKLKLMGKGSLVVRIIFLPFEESSYATFTQLASGQTPENVSNLEGSLLGALKLITLIVFINEYFKGSFSFYRCLPAGWGVLLISGLTTAFSERMFLNRNRFKQTLPIHMVIGIMCLGFSLLEIIWLYVGFSKNGNFSWRPQTFHSLLVSSDLGVPPALSCKVGHFLPYAFKTGKNARMTKVIYMKTMLTLHKDMQQAITKPLWKEKSKEARKTAMRT